MKVSQIIRSIKTNPEVWALKENNDFFMSFTYKGYLFTKFTNKVETYKGKVKLTHKELGVEMLWGADDAVGEQLWASVIMHYVDNEIIK